MISAGNARRYQVALHLFEVSQNISENFFADCMDNYAPFATEKAGEGLFLMRVEYGESPAYTEELCQDEEGQQIVCGLTAGQNSVFDFRLQKKKTGVLVCSKDYKTATLFIPQGTAAALLKFAVNNALMVLYAIASAPYNTALFHAAVVNYEGKGYMFLGKSGTGKSTHARLWLKHIDGSELMNDDNPVVRFFDDGNGGAPRAVVYGSPWSGKTPCYRNVQAPVGGIVLLSQAPFNKIVRLKGVQAYAALVTSISGKRWDKSVADGLHATENALAKNVPVWHLECLPDEAAAKLCNDSVIPGNDNNVIPGPDPESRWRLKAAMTRDGALHDDGRARHDDGQDAMTKDGHAH